MSRRKRKALTAQLAFTMQREFARRLWSAKPNMPGVIHGLPIRDGEELNAKQGTT